MKLSLTVSTILFLFITLVLFTRYNPDEGFFSTGNEDFRKEIELLSKTDEVYSSVKENSSAIFSSSAYPDEIEYLRIAIDKGKAKTPYCFRIFYPYLVSSVSYVLFGNIEMQSINYSWLLLNFIFLAAGGFIIYFLAASFPEINNNYVSSFCVLLFLFSPGAVYTLPYFFIDIPTFTFMAVIIYLQIQNLDSKWYFLPILIAALLTKEIFAVFIFFYLIRFIKNRKLYYLLYIAVVLIVFVGIRIWLNEDPLSVQHGWKISKGQIHSWFARGHVATNEKILLLILKILYAAFPLIVAAVILFFTKTVKSKFYVVIKVLTKNFEYFVVLFLLFISGIFLSLQLIRPWSILMPVCLYLMLSTFSEMKIQEDKENKHAG